MSPVGLGNNRILTDYAPKIFTDIGGGGPTQRGGRLALAHIS